MSKTIYVGNLPWDVTEQELSGVFEPYGSVEAVRIVTDRDTGRSRGFGFVEMDEAGADKAIDALNGTDMGGRNITVSEAQERQRRR